MGLMAHYPFDGNADDVSGNGNHGTTQGVTLTSGYRGDADGAYRFDGEDDYILVPDSDSLDLTTEATFALWVNVDPEISYGVFGSPHLFSKGATHGDLWADYALKLNETRALFEITDDANAPKNAVLPAIPEGRWVHLAVVYRDSTATLYQDGVTVTQPISTHPVIRVSDQPLYIGHRYTYNRAGRFEGAIDDLRIYNRALSKHEIANLAGLMAYYPFDGNADDASGSGNHGTAHGATLTSDRLGAAHSAYHFDGADDYILVPDSNYLDLTTSATFAMCVNVDPEINYGVYGNPHLFSKGATHGDLWADYALKLNETRALFEITDDANAPKNAVLPAIPEGRWVHLAVVYRDSTVTLYQNGITVTQPISTHPALRVSDQPLYIGHRYADESAGRFEGVLDNLRIYNRPLSGAEIQHLMMADCDRRIYLPLVLR
jgi:hypothetical protein